MPKDIWDNLEEAGHDFTHVGTKPGISLYICENCGSFLQAEKSQIILFHTPPNVHASPTTCVHVWDPPEKNLKKKLAELQDRDIEMFRSQAMAEDAEDAEYPENINDLLNNI